MRYYYITIVYRVLKINNCSIVWCDVLVWWYDGSKSQLYVSDIFSIGLHNDNIFEVDGYLSWDQYRRESIYRYSGLLYDKLKYLFSYNYRNVLFYTDHSDYDELYRVRCRFYTQVMCLEFVEMIHTGHFTRFGLDESTAQSLNFINS